MQLLYATLFFIFFLGMLFGRRLFLGIELRAVKLACTEPVEVV